MANIASLAIKVSANISDLTQNINTVTSSIGQMAKKVQTVTPTIKNLADAATGYGHMVDAVAAAQKRLNDSPLEGMVENKKILTETTMVAGRLKDRMAELGAGVADDILKMKPTISNIRAAQQQLESLKAIAEQTGQTELMAESIAQADANIQQLTANTVSAQTQMMSFKGVILGFQNLPFLILMEVLREVKKWLGDIVAIVDSRLGGFPSLLLKITAGLAGVIIVIGLMKTQMMGLVSTTSMWMTMWKSSIVYKGLVGVITLLNTVLGTQIAITTATLVWVGILTLGLAAIIAGVVTWVSWMFSASDATDKAAEKTKMLQNATEAYKNSLRDTVDEHKKMLAVMDRIRENALTPVQKAANRAAELQNAIDEPQRLQKRINDLQREIENRKKIITNTKDKEQIEEFKVRNEEAMKTLKELQDVQSKMQVLTQSDIAAQQAANRKTFAAEMGFDIAERLSNTAALEGQIESLKQIIATNDQRNQMTISETHNAIKNMAADYRKAEGIDKIVEPFRTAADILDTDNAKLKQWLDLGVINAEEYANGLKRAADTFRNAAGVDKFLDVSDTLIARQAMLDQQFAALDDLHRRKMISEEQLIGAQQKAAKAMLAQSEAGKMLQDAMEAVRPATDRLNDMIMSIEAEAAAARAAGMAISTEAVEKAIAMAEERMMGNAKAESRSGSQDNQALVRGSVAYTDFLRRDAEKDHLKNICNNSKRQVELAEKQVKATENLGENFTQRFEVIG